MDGSRSENDVSKDGEVSYSTAWNYVDIVRVIHEVDVRVLHEVCPRGERTKHETKPGWNLAGSRFYTSVCKTVIYKSELVIFWPVAQSPVTFGLRQ